MNNFGGFSLWRKSSLVFHYSLAKRLHYSLFIFVLRRPRQRHLHRIEHIFNENAVPRGGIVDQHVGDRTDELAVLNDGEPDTSVVKKGQQ